MARRKRTPAEIADTLGIASDSSGFAAVEELPEDPTTLQERAAKGTVVAEMERPGIDYGSAAEGFAGVDEARELERAMSSEDSDDRLAMFEKLSPKAKEVFLSTWQPDPIQNVMQNDPMWIDQKAVPEKLFLYWLSPMIIAELGWRGYLRVPNTEETRKWVPNIRLHPSQRWIMHGRMILGFKKRADWLRDRLRELKETNATREEVMKQFAPALRSRHASLGLTKQQAEALEKELGGVIGIRGPDPHNLPEPDLNKGEGE